MDAFAVARLVLGAGFLAVAAFLDVRTRRVRDLLWIAFGTVGLLVLALDIATSFYAANHWLLLGSAAILFYAVFYGKPILDEDGVHLKPARLLVLVAPAAAWFGGVLLPNPVDTMMLPAFARVVPIPELASVSVLILIYQLFYQTGLLRGGADAKDFLEPLDQLAAEGRADPAQLAVDGHSHGGVSGASVHRHTRTVRYRSRRAASWPRGTPPARITPADQASATGGATYSSAWRENAAMRIRAAKQPSMTRVATGPRPSRPMLRLRRHPP